MADKLRDRVAAALIWTTEQIEGHSDKIGAKLQTRAADVYLGNIEQHLGGRFANELPRYVSRIAYVENDPGGSNVSVDKTRDGLCAVTGNVFMFSHDLGWARTFTNFLEIDDDVRAEPVACTIKGNATAAFRLVAGSDSLLFALNPLIVGSQWRQAMVRDWIVAGFNGEQQAAPGQKDAPAGSQAALVRLVTVPSSADDVRNPPLDADGRLVLADGETVIYQGRRSVDASRRVPAAFDGGWHQTPVPAAPAEMWITNRRVAVVWEYWKEDPVAGALDQRRRLAGFAERDDGRFVACAQLTWAWVSYVFFNRSDGALQFQAPDQGMTQVRLIVPGFEAAEGERLLREAAASVAAYRLETDDAVDADAREALTKIRDGQAPLEELDCAGAFSLPSAFRIGRDPASLNEPS